MYKTHPAFLDPEKPFELLWRYMDWPRFFLLLKTKSLFFTSARLLQQFDSFEGSLPKKELEVWMSQLDWSLTMVHQLLDQSRIECFVSCWHYNDAESIAMWKLYAPTGNGIAIQTTIPEFKLAFSKSNRVIYAGKVTYIDYESDTFYQLEPLTRPDINTFVSFIHKRQIFSHEREYRAITANVCTPPPGQPGLVVPVDLRCLIKRVVVAPKTHQWILNAVQLLLDELLPGIKAERSIDDLTPDV